MVQILDQKSLAPMNIQVVTQNTNVMRN